jgi:iron complex transport system permease protein
VSLPEPIAPGAVPASKAKDTVTRTSRLAMVSLGKAAPIGLIILGIAIISGLIIGAVGLAWRNVIATLLDALPGVQMSSAYSGMDRTILTQVRLPRVVLAGLVGAALSLAGASYQGVFRNPLADPYLLGAASGAGVGATLVFTQSRLFAGWPINPLPIAAFAGAMLAVALSALMAKAVGAQTNSALGTATMGSSSVLLLAGVAVASFLTSVQTVIQQGRTDTLRRVYTWILGGLTTSGWSEVLLITPYLLVSAFVALMLARRVDVMALGDDEAKSLGVSPRNVRAAIIIVATLATAAAVSVSGLISFVGLIIPHAMRAMVGHAQGAVLIMSMIMGAAFLIATDTAARTIVAPGELPLGVLTAFVGAPTFALILIRQHRGRRS